MASADRRAKLLSGILGAKGVAEASDLETPPAEPVVPPAAEEVDRSAVLKIARRRAERPEGGTAGAATAPEPATTEGVLYSKGAATASNFKPWYWSYDHKDEGAPGESEAVVTRIPAPVTPPSEPPAAEAPMPLARAVLAARESGDEDKDEDERAETSGLSRIYVLLAVGCVALLLAGGGFVYWQSRDGEGAMPLTALQADRPATLLPAPARETAPPAAAPAPVSATTPAVAIKVPTAHTAVPPVPSASDAQPKTPETASAAPVSAPPAAETKAAPAPSTPPPQVSAAPAPPTPTASAQELAQLVGRGDELLATGDIAAARLFYERAAEEGSALAATAVGQTYDPTYLEQARVRGVRGDAKLAAEWYRKAKAAGDPQAEIRLKRLLARTGG